MGLLNKMDSLFVHNFFKTGQIGSDLLNIKEL